MKQWNPKIVLGLTFLSLIALYYKAFFYGFINFDDLPFITNNPWVNDFGMAKLKDIFTRPHQGHYSPITWLSYGIQYKLLHFTAGKMVILNLILHAFNISLIFKVTQQITAKNRIAGLSALVFALHPLHVESIVWKSAHSSTLHALFFLLAGFFWIAYLKEKKGKQYILAILFFGLSCLSKSGAMVWCAMAILLEWHMLGLKKIKSLIKYIPIIIIGLAVGLMAIYASKEYGSLANTYSHYNISQRVLIVVYAIFFYVQKFFWPNPLSAIHYNPDPNQTFPMLFYISPFLLIAFLLLAYWLFSKNNNAKSFWTLFFSYGILVSVYAQIIPVGDTIAAERYAYLVMLPIIILLALGMELLWKKNQWMGRFSLFALLLLFSIKTYSRVPVWETTISLFEDLIRASPDKYYSYYTLGVAYEETGELEKSEEMLLKSTQINTVCFKCYQALGNTYNSMKNYEKSIENFNKTIILKPDNADSYLNRGIAYYNNGNYNKAIGDFTKTILLGQHKKKALDFRIQSKMALKDYASALLDLNTYCKSFVCDEHQELQKFKIAQHTQNALATENTIQKMLSKFPNNLNLMNEVGLYYNQIGQYEKAISIFDAISDLGLNNAVIMMNKGIGFFQLKRYDQALNCFEKAYQLDKKCNACLSACLQSAEKLNDKVKIDYFQNLLDSKP